MMHISSCVVNIKPECVILEVNYCNESDRNMCLSFHKKRFFYISTVRSETSLPEPLVLRMFLSLYHLLNCSSWNTANPCLSV